VCASFETGLQADRLFGPRRLLASVIRQGSRGAEVCRVKRSISTQSIRRMANTSTALVFMQFHSDGNRIGFSKSRASGKIPQRRCNKHPQVAVSFSPCIYIWQDPTAVSIDPFSSARLLQLSPWRSADFEYTSIKRMSTV
jgi:hypothetical protein